MSSPATDDPTSQWTSFKETMSDTALSRHQDKALKALAALALGSLIVLTWRYGAELKSFVAGFTKLLADQGALGITAFVGIGVLWILLLLPASMVFLAGGAAWGLKWGLLISFTTNFLSGAAAFGIAKYFIEPRLANKQKIDSNKKSSKLALVRKAVQREGPRGAALLRFSALPAWAVNYGLGASGLSWKHYLAAGIAILPNTWAFVAAGHAAGLASQNSSRSTTEWALLITSIVGTVMMMALLGRRAKQILDDTDGSSESGGPPSERPQADQAQTDKAQTDKSTESAPS